MLQSLAGWIGAVIYYLFVLLVIAFACYCLYIKYIHMKYDHIPGPPRDSFFLGQCPTMLRQFKANKSMHDLFLEWSLKYGPVCRLNILHSVAIAVASPEATKEFLMSSKYPKDAFVYKKLFNLFGTRFLGNGLVTDIDHDHWYKQRRIMDPAFSNTYLRGLMETFNERVEFLVEKLEEAAKNNTSVHMHSLLNCVTLSVIAKVAFGIDLNLLETESPFPKAIETCLKGMVHYFRDPMVQLKPWMWGFIKEVKEAVRFLRRTGEECIRERKNAIKNGEEVPKDILTQILKTAELEEHDDHEQMLDNFLTFFIAGQETTANQLSFAVLELGRHPEILEKVRQEVDDVLGVRQDIQYEDLGKLTYMSQVLNETLRLYPTAPGTSRWIAEDVVIEGIHIPGGLPVAMSSYVAGRMEAFFPDPLKFDPERFHPDAPKPYYTYFPFALGPRSCLGKTFSQMEAKVVLAKLVQRFHFHLVPGQSFEIMDMGTLRPRSGVLCNIESRSQAS
ncbi:cholesterol 24-hydroxylase-like isoform X3 [Brienomyrus brachyistius]|uniref:cholesterol 24-hydroxylase-like isoform X3 n=1 Tax=Brienomyrus brachyistius TaxID=42636 RepID=UPI0020B4072F|nr:cholesterol 24-hydroxylase-like isoform X3 [Brienomyrus brachyistius]